MVVLIVGTCARILSIIYPSSIYSPSHGPTGCAASILSHPASINFFYPRSIQGPNNATATEPVPLPLDAQRTRPGPGPSAAWSRRPGDNLQCDRDHNHKPRLVARTLPARAPRVCEKDLLRKPLTRQQAMLW